MKWVYGGEKKLAQLVTRREAEAAMFLVDWCEKIGFDNSISGYPLRSVPYFWDFARYVSGPPSK